MRRLKTAESILGACDAFVQKFAALREKVRQGGVVPVAEMGVTLNDALTALGRAAEEELLNEAACAEPTTTRCSCGKMAVSVGFERKGFITRFGEVTAERRRAKCGSCGASWLPFDARWGVPEARYADDVREATVRLACRMGFDEAVEELRRFWPVVPDASTAHRWAVKEGGRAGDVARAEANVHWASYEAEAFATAEGRQRPRAPKPGFGVVEVDGVQALTWKPGQEPRRGKTEATAQAAAPSGKHPDGQPPAVATASEGAGESERAPRRPPPSTLSDVAGSPMGPKGRSPRVHGREICVGMAYLDRDACQESPGRGVLLEKGYVAELNNRKAFWTELHACAARQGVLDRETIVRLSDGGAYFIDHSDELLHDHAVVGILDIQHARQHVWEAGHKLCRDPKATAAWAAPRLDAVNEGKTQQLLDDLDVERQGQKNSDHRDALKKLHGYVERHKHLMDYPRYRDANYPVASGAVESANKRLVGRRCKQGGMIWSERGLEAIVNLRVALFNRNGWERLWPHTAAHNRKAAA